MKVYFLINGEYVPYAGSFASPTDLDSFILSLQGSYIFVEDKAYAYLQHYLSIFEGRMIHTIEISEEENE